MLSKNKIKFIQSLKDKKGRTEHGVFVVEGNKMVVELLETMACSLLVATAEFLNEVDTASVTEVVEVTEEELRKTSFLKTPQQVIGVFVIPSSSSENVDWGNSLSLMLDGIQDPGNLGTIIRLADWYGIQNILCSPDTADVYNPKVVQATMGALVRVKLHYEDLPAWIRGHSSIPVYGTFLDGKDIYNTSDLTGNGVIVMGNEGNGIRPEVAKLIDRRLLIPTYPAGSKSSESLNVAVATAIVCSEFRRRLLIKS